MSDVSELNWTQLMGPLFYIPVDGQVCGPGEPRSQLLAD